jgi:hypothetical protein
MFAAGKLAKDPQCGSGSEAAGRTNPTFAAGKLAKDLPGGQV